MLKLLDEYGQEVASLQLGKPVVGSVLQEILTHLTWSEATGLELEECARILGRSDLLKRTRHFFGNEATEEIVLNWR